MRRRHVKHPRSETEIRSNGPFLLFSEADGACGTGSAIMKESGCVRIQHWLAAAPGDVLLVPSQCAVCHFLWIF